MQQTEESTPAEVSTDASDQASGVVSADEPKADVDSTLGEESAGGEMLDKVFWDLLPETVQTMLEFLVSYSLLLLPIVVGVGFLIGKTLQYLLVDVGHRLTKRTRSDYDDRLLDLARRPLLTVPVLFSLMLVTSILPMPGPVREITTHVLATLILLSFTRAALGSCEVILELIADSRDRLDIIETRTLPMFDIAAKVIIVAVTGYLAFLIWGIDPTAWLASAGVIGIAVGFAARDTLANLFSGIFIVVDTPYKIGDYVVLDTGERGEVTHVGLRSTRLLTRDDVEVTIPNAIIANAKIINESGGPWEKYRIRIPVGVAYGSDVDQVSEVLEEVARGHPDIVDYPAPRVRMRRFGASSLDFELLGWVSKPVHRGRVTDSLLKSIYKRFQAEEITIPFPQTDVYLHRMGQDDTTD